MRAIISSHRHVAGGSVAWGFVVKNSEQRVNIEKPDI